MISAPHHGANSFFWENEPDDEKPYSEHLDIVDPEYIIVSAPKSSESKHDHPNKEAMDEYRKKVGDANVKHLGAKRECVIVDITENGDFSLNVDTELVKQYGILSNQDDKEEGYKKESSRTIHIKNPTKPWSRG